MGLGQITRTAGKIGIALEVGRFVWIAGKALLDTIRKREPSAPPPPVPPED